MVNKSNFVFWQTWLLKYKSFKCLWDSNAVATPEERLSAWNELLDMAKSSKNKEVNSHYLRGRLRNYVCKYKLEKKRVEVAKANGMLYEPAAFYYKIFKSIEQAQQCVEEGPEAGEAPEIVDDKNSSDVMQNELEPKSKLWCNVIERYTNFKCLWDRQNKKDYTNEERFKAYMELLKLVKPFYPTADIKFLKKRFKAMRTSYRREAKRLANDPTAKITLDYFDLLTPIYQTDSSTLDTPSDEDDADCGDEMPPEPVLSQEKMFWYNVLKKYVSLKCLWAHKKGYTPQERLKAWLQLVKIVRQAHAGADLKFVKKRINAYRTNYRRELNRIKNANERGIEYTSQLYYMNILSMIYESDSKSENDFSDEDNGTLESGVVTLTQEEDQMLTELSENSVSKRDFTKCTRDTKLWRKVIKKFVAFDCLWDKRYVYKKKERTDAWQELLRFLQSYYPFVHMSYLRKRISTLRSTFEEEHQQILAAQKNGISIKSELYYYELMRPMYELDGDPNIAYSSEESSDLINYDDNTGRDHPKYAALRQELESLGYICGPFETENLSHHQKALLLFLKKYVTLKCLWDPDRDNHTNLEREAAWHELLGMVQASIDPAADLTSVKVRINTYRTNYLRIFKKAKKEKEDGLDPEISLWYFNAISPIYQEGFPIILNEHEEIQDEETLNPRFSTYFPDDEKEAAKQRAEPSFSKHKTEVVSSAPDYTILPINVLEAKAVTQSEFEQYDGVGVLKEEQHIEDDIDVEEQLFMEMQQSQMTDDEASHFSLNEHFSARGDSPIQIEAEQIEAKQKVLKKRKISQSYENEYCENVESGVPLPQYDKFQTFKAKIADHLEAMECEQYLLAEKLISDVCVYGRLRKLSIETGFQLKKA